MRRLGLTLLGFLLLGLLALAGYKLWSESDRIPEEDQEIAWIHAATSGLIWERFVGGVQRLESSPEGESLGLVADYTNAFPGQTAATPEVILHLHGATGRVHIRWYKLTSTTDIAYWVRRLTSRRTPPLAIIGGGSSDRARDLAEELQLACSQHQSRTPLLLITTATADQVHVGRETPRERDLMQLYAGRSFRFCFTNSQMADAITDFVTHHPSLRPHGPAAFFTAAASHAAGGSPFAAFQLVCEAVEAPVYTLEWEDDPYSLDLAQHFRDALRRQQMCQLTTRRLPYSTGEYYRPNAPEAAAVEELATSLTRFSDQRPLLVLPAGDKPMRRVLRALAMAAPIDVRRAVVVSGDAINLDTVFRDRATSWNVQEMPTPVVFFSHENPVNWPADLRGAPPFQWKGCSSTHDLLLNATLVRLLLNAAYPAEQEGQGPRQLVNSAEALRANLRSLQPGFFDTDGNRLAASGAFVVVLEPEIDGGRVSPWATISVWSGRAEGVAGSRHWVWEQSKRWRVDYGESRSRSAG